MAQPTAPRLPNPPPPPPPQREEPLSGAAAAFPPAYTESTPARPNTRSQNEIGPWSKGFNKVFSPKITALNDNDAEVFPMIEVPNPRAGGEPTMLVHRTWTKNDIMKATANIPSYKDDPTGYRDGILLLYETYHLNGIETQQVLMATLELYDWGRIKEDWNIEIPVDGQNQPAPHDNQVLKTRLIALLGRVVTAFTKPPDYTLINQTKQNDTETVVDFRGRFEPVFRANSGIAHDTAPAGVYAQQLKNALLANMTPAITGWLQRHFVELPNATLPQFMSHAIHAEKVVKNKKKKENTGTFQADVEVHYSGGYRGRGRGRGRSRGKSNQERPKSKYVEDDKDDEDDSCFICKKTGHWAKKTLSEE